MTSRFSPSTLRWAINHPRLALSYLSGRCTYEELLQGLVTEDIALLKGRLTRLVRVGTDFLSLSQEETERIVSLVSPIHNERSHRMLNRWHSFLFAATLSLSPKTVIETGVLKGHSSAAILASLTENGSGKLISIDLPPTEHKSVIVGPYHIQDGLTPGEVSIGAVVPHQLRSRWKVILGDSLKVLPGILTEEQPISMFVHDSLHTYEHMMAEFRLGYDALEPGGLLISDDVNYNSAWSEFCRSRNEKWKTISKGGESTSSFAFLAKSK